MTLTDLNTPEEKIRRGIIDLQLTQPFFAYLVMNLRPRLLPKTAPMQTVGVNAKGELFYAPEWVMKQSLEVMQGVLCHEVLHVAFLHHLRRGNRVPTVANISQDVVVNMMVKQAGMRLPKDGIPVDANYNESRFELMGVQIHIDNVSKKTWEEIYDEIMRQLHNGGVRQVGQACQGQGQGKGQGQGGAQTMDDHNLGGGDDGTEPVTGKEAADSEQKWQGQLAEAAQFAKQRGTLPAGMDRYIDELLKPQINWPALLLKSMRPYFTPVDWTYQKPHKKSKQLGVYLPSTLKEHCEIEVIVDTSGSISKAELTEFLSEIVGIAQSMQHLKMWVTFVDAKVQARYEVDNGEIPKILAMEPKGGGGTSMEKGLDYIKEHNRTTELVVVFTDGYDCWERSKKDYPFDVIWVINRDGISEGEMKDNIPYGTKIKMD